jgi:CubicO group peptidase (beta-lactamase class C family)
MLRDLVAVAKNTVCCLVSGALLVGWTAQSSAGVMDYCEPEEVGMSAAVLAEAANLYGQAVAEDRVIGVVLLVARRGKIILHEAFGLRHREKNLRMEQDTHCRTASNTKTVVATGVLMLAEEERLELSDRVSEHLPAFDQGFSAKLTIRDLLRHATGFSNQLDNFAGEVTTERSEEFPDAPSLRTEAIKIGRVGPAQEPGGEFLYNNWGYTVLGAILEKCSDQQLDVFLDQRLYQPLGMDDSSHELFPEPDRLAVNYAKDSGAWEILPPDTPPFARSTGGMVTTVRDFAIFCQTYLNGGEYRGERILKPETIQQAISVQSRGPYMYISPDRLAARGYTPAWYYAGEDARRLGLRDGYGYGYGWLIAQDGAYHHGGFRGTFAYVDPIEELIILSFAQSRTGGNPGHEFVKKVYEALDE